MGIKRPKVHQPVTAPEPQMRILLAPSSLAMRLKAELTTSSARLMTNASPTMDQTHLQEISKCTFLRRFQAGS